MICLCLWVSLGFSGLFDIMVITLVAFSAVGFLFEFVIVCSGGLVGCVLWMVFMLCICALWVRLFAGFVGL